MNTNSTTILQDLGLPRTEQIKIEDLLDSETGSDLDIYVRYSTESKKRCDYTNLVLRKSQFVEKIDSYMSQIKNGDIVSIERKYNTLLGGATLYKNGFTYTEFVKGHSVALLRRGLCGARFVISDNGQITAKKSFQRFYAEQHESYQYHPTVGPNDAEITAIIESINKYSNNGKTGLLIEWMYTEESGLLCCDAKNGFNQFGNELHKLGESSIIDVFLTPNEKTKFNTIIIDNLDCDNNASELGSSMTYLVNNGALLSHVITRSVLSGECGVVLSNNALSGRSVM